MDRRREACTLPARKIIIIGGECGSGEVLVFNRNGRWEFWNRKGKLMPVEVASEVCARLDLELEIISLVCTLIKKIA